MSTAKPRSRTAVIVGVCLFLGILAVVIYSSFGLRGYRVQVCMNYEGQTECRAASGTTREEAIRTAIQSACTLIAPGMSALRRCETSTPASVQDLH